MHTISTVHEMQAWADATRTRGERIGFVPTMGYLHDGHISLVGEARRRSDRTVASIFVNPLQFGANEDLARYPRDLEGDRRRLTGAGTDVLFLPKRRPCTPRASRPASASNTSRRDFAGRRGRGTSAVSRRSSRSCSTW